MGVHGFTVYDMIERGAAAFGDAPAVIEGERVLSFAEFRARADALAGGLAALGLGAGDRICVLAQNATAYLELYGACARQGIVAYPINWRLTAHEVELVVDRAAPRMMVVDASTLGVVSAWPETKRAIAHWYQLGEPAAAGFRPFAALYRAGRGGLPADVSADHPFAVISTAAVDVVPRGAVLTHANVLAANLTIMSCLGLGATDRYLVALPLFHITALGVSLAHLHAGGASVVVSRFDAEEAVRLIDRHRDHAPLGLSPRPHQRPGRGGEAGEPAAQPDARLRPRRAPDRSSACTSGPRRRSGPGSVSRRPAGSSPCNGCPTGPAPRASPCRRAASSWWMTMTATCPSGPRGRSWCAAPSCFRATSASRR